MASFNYHTLPGFGEECHGKYGFSDACIIGNRLVITGQVNAPGLPMHSRKSHFKDSTLGVYLTLSPSSTRAPGPHYN